MAVAQRTGRAPLVGRREELASLVTALEELPTTGSRWVTVSGEPGTGKTRLVAPNWSANCRSGSG